MGCDFAAYFCQRFAVQRIAAAQVVIQKRQRRADGERVQPQRELRQLHRHRILVHPMHDALQDHAAHEMAVVEQSRVDRPLAGLRLIQDAFAQAHDVARDGGVIVRDTGSVGLHADIGKLLQHAVGQIVDETDEKMAAAHRRIADAQIQERFGGIGLGKTAIDLFRCELGKVLVRIGHARIERGDALLDQRRERLAQDQLHQIVVGVVAAGILARKHRRLHDDTAIGGFDQALFEQAFVDRAEMLHGQIAVIDEAATADIGAPRQAINQGAEFGVGQFDTRENIAGRLNEQAAVVRRQADRRIALVDGAKQVAQMLPGAGDRSAERIAAFAALGDVIAQPAQRVAGVALIVDRQQRAIFGVQDEQQAIQQNQRGAMHGIEILARIRPCGGGIMAHDSRRQARKQFIEYALAQILRNPGFPQPTFIERERMKTATVRIAGLRQKRYTAE